eukprot:TRINITY_DN265_c0_g1_i2.p2 TRINITY_DN265_c0_g1~~TRINITY_DN265_c0_g1_i2.p2  ORF type:complete len:127 (-),score=30.08 TRINITY_DN265_c0_g1_i2:71-451(-)
MEESTNKWKHHSNRDLKPETDILILARVVFFNQQTGQVVPQRRGDGQKEAIGEGAGITAEGADGAVRPSDGGEVTQDIGSEEEEPEECDDDDHEVKVHERDLFQPHLSRSTHSLTRSLTLAHSRTH